jgi:hypothetical protein
MPQTPNDAKQAKPDTKVQESAGAQNAQNPQNAPAQQPVRWGMANLKSTYANFVHATSTREEVVLNFGVNQSWDRVGGALEIDLEHRVILSPFAAKRLSELLKGVIAEYETRFGELK